MHQQDQRADCHKALQQLKCFAGRLSNKCPDAITPAQCHTGLTHIVMLEKAVDVTARAWEARPRQQAQALAAAAATPGRALARAVLKADLGQLTAAAGQRLEELMVAAGAPTPLPKRKTSAGAALAPAAYAKRVIEAALQAAGAKPGRKLGDLGVDEALLTRLGRAYATLPPLDTPEQVARVCALVADLLFPQVSQRPGWVGRLLQCVERCLWGCCGKDVEKSTRLAAMWRHLVSCVQ
jgi:hypothetical protein